jgi:hypothetical protein
MSNWMTSRTPKFILGAALLFPGALSSQTPAQPGRLRVTSMPDGAAVTVNGTSMSRRTPADFVVAPGTYTVSTVGQSGKSTCQNAPFTVSSGATLVIDCSNGTWK